VNLKSISLFVIAGVVGFGANAQIKQPEDVLQTLKKYDEAWNKKDSATVDKLLAAEYVYFSSTGTTASRQRTLEFLSSPKYHLTSAERSEIKTFRTGDTVIVSSRWKGKGTYNEEAINDDQRCSLVFAKQGKLWKLLSEHCTQIVSR